MEDSPYHNVLPRNHIEVLPQDRLDRFFRCFSASRQSSVIRHHSFPKEALSNGISDQKAA